MTEETKSKPEEQTDMFADDSAKVEKKEEKAEPPVRKVYKIVSVFLKNFMGAPNGVHRFEGKSVFLCAKNARGKTDIVTAVYSALTNEKLDMPIKAGFHEANNIITLIDNNGEKITLEVTYASNDEDQSSYFEIKTPEGKTFRDPKSLKALVGGNIGFDVEKFIRETEYVEGMRNNIKIIKKFLGEEKCNQIAAIDESIKKTKEEREELNTRILKLRTILKGNTYNEQDIYEYSERKDITKLNEEYQKAVNASSDQKAKEVEKTKKETQISDLKNDIADIEREIAEKQKKLAEKNEALKVSEKELEEIQSKLAIGGTVEVKSVDEISREIKLIDEHNKKVDSVLSYVADKTEYDAKFTRWTELGKLYPEYDEQKKKIISESPLPVKGLSFDEDGIYIKLEKNPAPIPITQLSTAERTRYIGVPLAIAENPKIRIIHIGNAESMDFDTLKFIQEYADENDYQVFYEEVDRTAEEIVVRFSEDVIK